MKTKSMLDAALDYASRGWKVMPLKAGKKDPHFDLIKNAYLSATDDLELIKFWYSVDPKANLGIACSTSGLIVIDIDFRNGGKMLDIFNETYTVKTGDGLHLYYKANPDFQYKATFEAGIDIKYKGYVAAAPSIHPNGKIYEIVKDLPVAEMSNDLLAEVIR